MSEIKKPVQSSGANPAQRKSAVHPSASRPAATARHVGHAPAKKTISSAKPVGKKKPAKKAAGSVNGILKSLGRGGCTVLRIISKPFIFINQKFDFFRKSEASAIIFNSILAGMVIAVLLGIFLHFKPALDDNRAQRLAAKGKFDEALRILSVLERDEYPEEKLQHTRLSIANAVVTSSEYERASSLITDIADGPEKSVLKSKYSYANANDLYEQGDYVGAAQIFYQLDNFKDSEGRYADCRCALAIEAWQAGNESSARSLLLNVPNAVERVNRAAIKVAGSGAEAQKILSNEIFSTENLLRQERVMENLASAREDKPEGRIAAGWHHTVAVNSQGKVLATGDNSYGQCKVSEWSDISQVAAGALHTVALRSDGTVLATGNNSYGQCNVSTWTDITAIAAGTVDTIGLKSDGTIVAAGMHAENVSSWRNATFVAAGSYSMGCLYDNGAMLCSHKAGQMDMGTVLYDLSVCGQVSVGVLYDGTLVSSYEGAPKWDGIVSATACESGILAIDTDGKVRSHFYRSGNAVEISVPSKAIEIESSGTHHVVLCEDGRVYAFGENDNGQCNVSEWRL